MSGANGIEFEGEVRGGKLPARINKLILALLSSLEGKRVAVRIRPVRKKRSSNQNAFYWGVVIPIIKEMFYDATGDEPLDDDLHLWLKENVGNLMKTVRGPDGKDYRVACSSADLSTIKWEEFIEKIRAWAAPYGVIIPFPNEILEEKSPVDKK